MLEIRVKTIILVIPLTEATICQPAAKEWAFIANLYPKIILGQEPITYLTLRVKEWTVVERHNQIWMIQLGIFMEQ